MGKLNVALLRYLSREDFRVLTAVRDKEMSHIYTYSHSVYGNNLLCEETERICSLQRSVFSWYISVPVGP